MKILGNNDADIDEIKVKGLKFTIDLPTSFVREELSKLAPNTWQCHLSSGEEDLDLAQTTAYLSVDPPSDNVPLSEAIVKDQKNSTSGNNTLLEKEDIPYFFCLKSSITRAM